ELSPDQPMHYYWFRTERGAPRESRSMDPRLREVSEAFGAGDFERARELARALLDLADDPTLRSEAASYLTQSHLAQGDFEGARAAAQRLNDHESLALLSRLEAQRDGQVGRLQEVIARSNQPPAVRRARRRLARLRLEAGEGHDALQGYYRDIAADPNSSHAQAAIQDIAEVTTDSLGEDACGQLLVYLRDQYSGTGVAAMADYELALLAVSDPPSLNDTPKLLAVIQQHTGSSAAALAGSLLREKATLLLRELEGLQDRGKHTEVVAHFVELAPYFDCLDQADFAKAIGTLRSSAGHFSLAYEALPAAAALLMAPGCRNDPEKMVLLYQAQGDLAAQAGDDDAAVRAWRHLLDTYSSSAAAASAALRLGDHYLAAGRPDEAAEAYMHARRAVGHLSAEERAYAMVGIGLAFEGLGRLDEAAFEFRAAIGLTPDSPAADEAASRLRWMGQRPK
ncbi:MAG: tetratricopeptide repeat protein, partial [Armatimonadota bacterium]